MNEKTKAAAIGGVVAGILSVIPVVSNCCCIWAILGGFLAAFLYMKKAPGPMTPGDGAMLGAMAGGIGAVIYLIIGLPILLMFGTASIEQAIRQSGQDIPFSGMALVLCLALMVVVIIVVGAAIGGLIGTAVLGRGAAGAPPPPPPNFGGPTGGPTGGGSYGAGS
jgi:hypothetical protein